MGELWRALQARPAFADNTVLMVTSDHGCDCDGCQQVTFVAVGPGVNPACAPAEPWELVDIVPTIGAIQGWVPAYADGEVMQELLLED